MGCAEWVILTVGSDMRREGGSELEDTVPQALDKRKLGRLVVLGNAIAPRKPLRNALGQVLYTDEVDEEFVRRVFPLPMERSAACRQV